MPDGTEHITKLLSQAAEGDADAAREVMPRIYKELHRLAGKMRGQIPPGETLQATALVHEAYLRVMDREPEGWRARSHFFFAAARAMRDILVEEARKKATSKRGGGLDRVEIEEIQLPLETPTSDILALHDVLSELEKDDPEGYQFVMLRYFAGLTVREVAEITGQALTTVERRWRYLRAWLAAELDPDNHQG